jgi:hypothetical protein
MTVVAVTYAARDSPERRRRIAACCCAGRIAPMVRPPWSVGV